jgi:hypothetical protein
MAVWHFDFQLVSKFVITASIPLIGFLFQVGIEAYKLGLENANRVAESLK